MHHTIDNLNAMRLEFADKKGFTLIELLVVVAIIGLLSSVVLTSLNSARGKARDARRIADLSQMQLAVELFYDSNNRYPSSVDGDCTHLTSFLPGGCLENTVVTEGFISTLPKDPNPSAQYFYDNWCREPNGFSDQKFRMWANGEFNNDGLARNWWYETTIGETNCKDPS